MNLNSLLTNVQHDLPKDRDLFLQFLFPLSCHDGRIRAIYNIFFIVVNQ